MNPESVPLHGTGHGDPAQPGVTTVIQNTNVRVVTDPPKDHIIWSLCCFVYYNPLCLGLAALINSIKSRDRMMAGDLEGARSYGSTARRFNIASSILAALGAVIFIIVITVFLVNATQSYSYGYNSYSNNYGNSHSNSYGNRYGNRYGY